MGAEAADHKSRRGRLSSTSFLTAAGTNHGKMNPAPGSVAMKERQEASARDRPVELAGGHRHGRAAAARRRAEVATIFSQGLPGEFFRSFPAAMDPFGTSAGGGGGGAAFRGQEGRARAREAKNVSQMHFFLYGASPHNASLAAAVNCRKLATEQGVRKHRGDISAECSRFVGHKGSLPGYE